MQEHVVQKVSHWLTANTTLEAGRVAGDVEVLDGDLGIVTHLLSTVRTGRRHGRPGVRAAVGIAGRTRRYIVRIVVSGVVLG